MVSSDAAIHLFFSMHQPKCRHTQTNHQLVPDRFIQRFGTHFVSSAVFGFNLFLFATADSNAVTKMNGKFEAEASAALDFLIFAFDLSASAGAGASFSYSKEFAATASFGAMAFGGNPVLIGNKNFTRWLDSVVRNPMLLSATYKNVSELVADETTATLLQEAVDEYLHDDATAGNNSWADISADGSVCTSPPGINMTFAQLAKLGPSPPRKILTSKAVTPLPAMSTMSIGHGWDLLRGAHISSPVAPNTFYEQKVWLDIYQLPETETYYSLADSIELVSIPAACIRGRRKTYVNGSMYISGSLGGALDYFSLGIFPFKNLHLNSLFKEIAAGFDVSFTEKGLAMFEMQVSLTLFELVQQSSAALDSGFVNAMENLPANATGPDSDFDDFVRQWGTHYVSSQAFGGHCNFSIAFKESVFLHLDLDAVEASATVTLALRLFHVLRVPLWMWKSVVKDLEGSAAAQFTAAITNVSFHCSGGNEALLGSPQHPSNGSFPEWLLSVARNPMPLPSTIRFRPISNLITTKNLSIAAFKRDAVNKAIANYLTTPSHSISVPKKSSQKPQHQSTNNTSTSRDATQRTNASATSSGWFAWQMVPGVCPGGVGVGCGFDATKIDAFGLEVNPKKSVVQMKMCQPKCYREPAATSDPACERCTYSPPAHLFDTDNVPLYRVPQNVVVDDAPESQSCMDHSISHTADIYDHETITHEEHSSGWIIRHHHSKTTIDFYHQFYEQNRSMALDYQAYIFHSVSLLPFPDPIRPTLEFSIAESQLPLEYDPVKYREFIDDFGTHYMDTVYMGAMALSTCYFHSCFLDIWSGEKVFEQSSSSFLFIWHDVHGGGHGFNKTDVLFTNYSQTTVKLLGGDSWKHGRLDKDHVLNQTDIDAWKKSIQEGDKMVPIRFSLTPITTLVQNPIKRAFVNRSIAEYVGEVSRQTEALVNSLVPPDKWKTPKWCHYQPPHARAPSERKIEDLPIPCV